jgi:hypothetical protein
MTGDGRRQWGWRKLTRRPFPVVAALVVVAVLTVVFVTSRAGRHQAASPTASPSTTLDSQLSAALRAKRVDPSRVAGLYQAMLQQRLPGVTLKQTGSSLVGQFQVMSVYTATRGVDRWSVIMVVAREGGTGSCDGQSAKVCQLSHPASGVTLVQQNLPKGGAFAGPAVTVMRYTQGEVVTVTSAAAILHDTGNVATSHNAAADVGWVRSLVNALAADVPPVSDLGQLVVPSASASPA